MKKWIPIILASVLTFSLASATGAYVLGQKIVSDQASGSDGLAFTVNGARAHLGTGANDYFASDGTSISAAGAFSTNGDLSVNAGRVFARSATGGFSFGVAGSQFLGMGAGSSVITVDNGGVFSMGGAQGSDERLKIGGSLFIDNVAPTISSGFGTSPSVTASSGTAVFRVNVGTGGTASTGVIAFTIAATTGWNCTAGDVTTPDSFSTVMISSTTNTATFKNYSRTTGIAIAWTASDILAITCFGF